MHMPEKPVCLSEAWTQARPFCRMHGKHVRWDFFEKGAMRLPRTSTIPKNPRRHGILDENGLIFKTRPRRGAHFVFRWLHASVRLAGAGIACIGEAAVNVENTHSQRGSLIRAVHA